ncbi:MAG: hypothetical protein IKA60_01875 [Rikenellaceae bacterium]|nr:hypothetical protein [Rikenellaceae bacterium]
MKKFILSLAVCLCAAFAANAQDWAIGGRVGSGLQAQAELGLTSNTYLEGRLGMGWANLNANLNADFTALHNWNVCTMDWTPSAGQWFFDAGCGVTVGGAAHYAYVGVAGCAKLGIKFNSAPVKLSIDWTPSFGPGISYGKSWSDAWFHDWGMANLGISAVYCF